MLNVNRTQLGNASPSLLRAGLIVVSIVLMHVAASAPAQGLSPAIQSRIARVEQGLSSRVVVKGAPGQKMSLATRMAFHDVPAVSIALINDGHIEWARAYGWTDQLFVDIRTP